MDALSILQDISNFTRSKEADKNPVRFARIDYSFDPSDFPHSLPSVVFDGESTASTKGFPCMGGYWPQPGDRVVMLHSSANFYLILGPVNPTVPLWTMNAETDEVDTGGDETTTSETPTDLATFGPEVTLQTTTSALVSVCASIDNASTSVSSMGFAVSGATTRAANNDDRIFVQGTDQMRFSGLFLIHDLTPGRNTFAAKYWTGSSSNAAMFRQRLLTVIPL